MRHSHFYALGLFLTATSATLGFEHSNGHYLRGLGHKHRSYKGTSGVSGINDNAYSGADATAYGHPTWKLTDSFCGKEFYEGFTFETVFYEGSKPIADPTHGRVNYVDMQTAKAKCLTEVTENNNFIMRADSTTVLDTNGTIGRDSIRIQSKKQWTTGVTVLNVNHLPQGCATWPAFWMTQVKDWPINGEIDVIEGVNDQTPNESTLHTSPNCVVRSSPMMTGKSISSNCTWLNNYNQGCPVGFQRQDSYGPSFNTNGGGWFVAERMEQKISVWFWGRHDHDVPPAVTQGLPVISTKDFGTPAATWDSSESCDLKKHMGPQNIIINLTFCGDRAGQPALSQAAGCSKGGETCAEYVDKHPEAFKEAYWDISWLKVYSESS